MELRSQITGRTTDESHYLAEIAILRQAKKKKVKLSDGFWNDRVWKKEYQGQLIAAHALLKIFQFSDILKALNSKEANWVFSLRYKGLIDVIHSVKSKREFQESQVKQNTVEIPQINQEELNVIAKPHTKKSLGSKLRD